MSFLDLYRAQLRGAFMIPIGLMVAIGELGHAINEELGPLLRNRE